MWNNRFSQEALYDLIATIFGKNKYVWERIIYSLSQNLKLKKEKKLDKN